MAESKNTPNDSVFSANDPLDINELASLNEDFSVDFIEQLQNQISSQTENDGALFEEPVAKPAEINNNFDDDFAKRYRKKMERKKKEALAAPAEESSTQASISDSMAENHEELEAETIQSPVINETAQTIIENESVESPIKESFNETKTENLEKQPEDLDIAKGQQESKIQNKISAENSNEIKNIENNSIESISGGNITEKPVSKEGLEYNKSLDYLDNNVKYSKYVIYIDPENKEFIDSLTVKERKNLINRIIREQDSIALTKQKLNKMQTIITHAIIAALTIIISVPCLYWVFNSSLEATINNYRNSQTMFGALYKEKGKIKTNLK